VADDITHYDAVEGYCRRLSYSTGETVQLCVSTATATFDVAVCRWGEFREVVWTAKRVAGVEQVTPVDADANGCGWDVIVEIPVDPTWRSGFYLVELTADSSDIEPNRRVGYACFVVLASAAQPRNRALFVLATNTWNAYNNWGGKSLYTGGHQVAFQRPFGRGMLMRPETERDDRKSRPRRRGEQPDVDGEVYQKYRFQHGYPGYMGSAGWFTYDRQFASWAESNGFELDYAVSSDLETVADLTNGYQLVIGAGHDEYWSSGMRDAIEQFVAAGGNYASFSGNTMFWQVRLEQDNTTMVCHKYSAHLDDPVVESDPSAATGMWGDPMTGRPESRFLGAASMYGLYSRFGKATPRGIGGFVVYRDDHWMLDRTGLRYGDVLGSDHGVVGYETVGTRISFDGVNLPVVIADPALPDPDDVEIVGFTPSSNLAMGEYPASIAALDDQGDLEFIAERVYGGGEQARARVRHGNSVMLCCWPCGRDAGQVVTIGSTDWVFGLGDPQVSAVTANVLRRLS
jgi:hypothetical protein